MRILYCNKYNFPFSGTEAYLFEVMDLMRSQGHEVALFSMADPRGDPTPYDRYFVPYIDFKKQRGLWQKAKLAAHAIYSRDARHRIRALIEEFRPDVAHVRNIYHHLSPSILFELKAQNVPVVYHLNDFKLLCPSYNMVSGGESCEACKGGEFWHMMAVKCYPGIGARLTLVAEAYVHRGLGTYTKCVDRFLAPSQFVRDKFVEHGWNAQKFDVLPHFQTMPFQAGPSLGKDAPLLYFGRLSQEKGVGDLLQAMKLVPSMRLIIAGDGPQRDELLQLTAGLGLGNVEFVGHVARPELQVLIARSRFTVLPSHAYETLGKTILESYAQTKAVIASDLGSRRELVHPGETGLLYPTGDVKQLAACIRALGEDPALADEMGRKGRELVRERYTPAAHCEALLGLYRRTIATKRMAGKRKGGSGPTLVATSQAPPWGRIQPQAIASSDGETVLIAARKSRLRIAFIGGRGVISKYSGIETYYEEVGARMAQKGHEVTVYCRSYFTPSLKRHNGMRLVRLPTIQSKHWETLVHTILSTAHVLTQKCDVVHYHALGPALFLLSPEVIWEKDRGHRAGFGLAKEKMGMVGVAGAPSGRRCVCTPSQWNYGRIASFTEALPQRTWG